QAEDGIRGDLVTGVQTCALPILGIIGCRRPLRSGECTGGTCRRLPALCHPAKCAAMRGLAAMRRFAERARGFFELPIVPGWRTRSEERRVGKECRTWGGQDARKK